MKTTLGFPRFQNTKHKTQNTNRTTIKANPCFEIPPLISKSYVRIQNTDFLTLRGRCPPL